MSVVLFCRKHDEAATASKRHKTSHVKEYVFNFCEFNSYFVLVCLHTFDKSSKVLVLEQSLLIQPNTVL